MSCSKTDKGFTLVELVIVMAVIGTILSTVMSSLKGMQNEASLTKAEGELTTIKSAVTSYWRNNSNVFPNAIADMVNASPQILTEAPRDPFNTDGPGAYGYMTGSDPTFGIWFLACTRGPRTASGGGGDNPAFDIPRQAIVFPTPAPTFRCVSNAPVFRSDGSAMSF